MRFQEGNSLWKNRSKIGRELLFATPELLWEEACKYFEFTDSRVWIQEDWVGKDAISVERKSSPPYTLTGLYLYLDCNAHYFNDFKGRIKDKTDEQSIVFSEVISRIEQIIYTQKFEGAAVGAFNANIISRDLGLADKTENSIKMEQPLFPDIKKNELPANDSH